MTTRIITRVWPALWAVAVLCGTWGAMPGRGEAVATPEFGVPGGCYAVGFDVGITCATAGATIRYTVNGQDPILIDPALGEAETLLVSGSVTLRARAWREGMEPSDVASVEYQITGEVAAGQNHALGLQSGGSVFSWGLNDVGQLGRSQGSLNLPYAVPGMTVLTTRS